MRLSWPSVGSTGVSTSSSTRTRSWPPARRPPCDAMVKRHRLVLVFSLAAIAATPPAPSPTAAKASLVLLAHVVSMDADAHTLVYRTPAGDEKTAPVAA